MSQTLGRQLAMWRWTKWMALCLLLGAAELCGQQAVESRPNELAKAKLVYVAPMPRSLDQWIVEDLRVWGKYRRTSNPEGVDLVIEAQAPERPSEIQMHGGVPRPREKKGSGSSSDHCPRLKPSESPALTINVVDWVTGERLWYVHLLDKKPKKEDAEIPPGPHTDIFIRDLTPDQIAMKLVSKLREYVSQLDHGPVSGQ